jgi:hypothetical protein
MGEFFSPRFACFSHRDKRGVLSCSAGSLDINHIESKKATLGEKTVKNNVDVSRSLDQELQSRRCKILQRHRCKNVQRHE